MQAEIDELRAENARLKAVPMKYKRMAFNAELQAENARLRDALYEITCLSPDDAKDIARAALGES